MIVINSSNRKEIQGKYIDDLISRMGFMECRRHLWDYLNSDKDKLTNEILQVEIVKNSPKVLEKQLAGSLHVEGYQNA